MTDPASSPENTPPNEPELSAEAQETLKKAKRAFGSGLLIMILGLVAVLGVMIYKLNNPDEGTQQIQASSQSDLEIDYISETRLPSGAQIISASAQANLISITYRLNEQVILRLVNATSGAILQDITLQ